MAQLNNARQWQRFAYPADVALATDCEAPEPQVVAALAVDLSLGGMQLLAANAPRVGAAISCKFPNDHSELQLRGFVRWSTPAPSPGTRFQARVGVEFEPLSSMARQVVQALISHAERAGELVRVQLPHWPFALQGVAVPSERGVRLHVPLPSIAQGSTIKFMSLSPETPLEGRVLETEVTMCRKTQAFELSLVLEPSEPARRRRYTVYDQPAVVSAAHVSDAAVPPPSVGRSRWHVALLTAAVLLGGLGWFGVATRPVFHMRPHHVALEVPAVPAVPAVQATSAELQTQRQVDPAAAAPTTEATAALVEPEPTVIAVAEDALRTTPADPSAERNAPPRGPAPSSQEAERAGEEPGEPAAARARPDASPAPNTGDPTFTIDDQLNEVFVPVHGSLASLRTAVWADPSALVVDLPDATVGLTHARYSTHTGCLLGLSVGRPRGVLQLRVYLSEKVVRYTTNESPGGLLIRVRCAAEGSEQSP